tara:strand:- start:342 stop:1328 length:987 start_codon:yes stop_codon:yes gene_type:complete
MLLLISKQLMNNNLKEEADAFDSQIKIRINNGHIPDLRMCQPCDYFYNNTWRRKFYVDLDFGDQLNIFLKYIKKYIKKPFHEISILEIGCGPGYMSLELARSGLNVTGIDISQECIKIANEYSEKDPFKEKRGNLNYFCSDFLSNETFPEKKFDLVFTLGALHHFRDQKTISERINTILKEDGLVMVHEPVRDKITKLVAAISFLIRSILSISGGFYKKYPNNNLNLDKQINDLYNELKYEDDGGNNLQSINDNEAGYAEMYPNLIDSFHELIFEWRYALFHEIIGGLRFDEKVNEEISSFICEIDKYLVTNDLIQGTEFIFVGRKKK